jgi:hypothetical protein
MRLPTATVVWFVALLAASPELLAAEHSPVWKDGWTINVPGGSNWVSDGTPSPFAPSTFMQGTPSASYTPGSAKDPYGFADYSVGHTLGFGRELGLGNVQATLGVRVAEPLATNGFTPSFDPRRYLGTGPRVGLEGNNPLQSSWVVEWQVGAAMLSGDRALDTSGVINSPLQSFANSGSVFNVDGLVRHGVKADARLSRRLFQRLVRGQRHGHGRGQCRPRQSRTDGPVQHPEVTTPRRAICARECLAPKPGLPEEPRPARLRGRHRPIPALP